jgi:hypothetical protein
MANFSTFQYEIFIPLIYRVSRGSPVRWVCRPPGPPPAFAKEGPVALLTRKPQTTAHLQNLLPSRNLGRVDCIPTFSDPVHGAV